MCEYADVRISLTMEKVSIHGIRLSKQFIALILMDSSGDLTGKSLLRLFTVHLLLSFAV
jgi:hypothetical protein